MLLASIWYGSLSLAAFSLLIMFYLIVRRLVTDFFERRYAARRERTKLLMFGLINEEITPEAVRRRLRPRDQKFLLEISGQLRRGLKGEPEDKLVSLLNDVVDVDIISRELRKGTAAERAALCAELSWSSNPVVHQALRDRLDDSEADVVLAAANALLESGAGLSLHGFALKVVKNKMLGHRGVRDLFRKLAPQQVQELRRLVRLNIEEVGVLAADALARCGDISVIPDLNEQVKSNPFKNVRAECLRSLGELRHPDGEDAVLYGLEDQAWEVRTQAAIAAGRIGTQDLVPLLKELLQEERWWVQFRAAEALSRLGDIGRSALQRATQDVRSARVAELALAQSET